MPVVSANEVDPVDTIEESQENVMEDMRSPKYYAVIQTFNGAFTFSFPNFTCKRSIYFIFAGFGCILLLVGT